MGQYFWAFSTLHAINLHLTFITLVSKRWTIFSFCVFVSKTLTYLTDKQHSSIFLEYFVCHFYFLWPKIIYIIFTPKAIRCYRSLSNFYRFYFWLRVFHFLQFGKTFLACRFNSFDFFTATIFSKYSAILLITSFTAFFFA